MGEDIVREKTWTRKSSFIEKILYDRILSALKLRRGLRKPLTIDIFDRITYITPEDVVVKWIRKKPLAVFNPGAYLESKKLYVFPRIIYGYYHYASMIGVFSIDIEDLLTSDLEKPIEVNVLLYPTEPWELALGCEDPRIWRYNDLFYILYTGVAPDPENPYLRPTFNVTPLIGLQGIALVDLEYRVLSKNFIRIRHFDEVHVPSSWRDSAIVDIVEHGLYSMLCRPMVKKLEICMKCLLDIDSYSVEVDTMDVVLANESWEVKVGWSTNALKIGGNEYLIGWHGVSSIDGVYRNGLAIVNREGDLIALTPYYVLSPKKNVYEFYGDRPGVIFGNGLIEYSDYIIWVGGVGDHMIGFFSVEKENLFEHIKYINKH